MKNDSLDMFIRSRWMALEITQAEFARRMGKKDSYIEQVRTGDKTFPLDAVDEWAERLQLSPEKTEEFRNICRASNGGAYRNAWIRDLELRTKEQEQIIAAQQKQIADLTKKYQALMAQLDALTQAKRAR